MEEWGREEKEKRRREGCAVNAKFSIFLCPQSALVNSEKSGGGLVLIQANLTAG